MNELPALIADSARIAGIRTSAKAYCPAWATPGVSADPEATAAAVQTAVSELGRLDILVNSAGVKVAQPFGEMTAESIDRALAIYVRAVLLATQAAARHLRRGTGGCPCGCD